MAKDVLIIYPQINEPPNPRELLELGVYVAMLSRSGFDVQVRLLRESPEISSLVESIREEVPGIFFFFIKPEQYSFLADAAPPLREAFPGVHFCCGGLMPTLNPEAVISLEGMDSLIFGEGEGAMVEFLSTFRKGKDYKSIRNFWFKTPEGEYQKNPLRPPIEDLDIFPYADRSFYPHDRLLDYTGDALPILASRGCPYNCLFCSMPHMRNIYKGKGEYNRTRSVNHLIGEILERRARTSFKSVLFLDDIFPTLTRKWLGEFVDRYRSQVNLPFHITTVVEQLDKMTLQSLLTAGCSGLTLGVETGNEAFRKRVSDRNAGNKNIMKTVYSLKEMGFEVHIANMIGLPLETEDLLKETIEFNKALEPDRISTRVFFPFPTTSLYHYCKEKGYLTERSFLDLKEEESVLDLPYIKADMIRKALSELSAMNCRQRIKSAGKPRGSFDLLHYFSTLDSDEGKRSSITCDDMTLAGETYPCLIQLPNTKLTLRVKLKSRSYLHFGLGIEPSLREFDSRTFFRFTIVLTQEKKEHLVFEKYLNPGKDPKDLEWFQYELPIVDTKKGSALLRLEYRTSLESSHPVRGLWRRPVITGRRVHQGEDQVLYTENELSMLNKEVHDNRILVEELQEEKKNLLEENEKLKKELDKTVGLAGKLQKQSLKYEEELSQVYKYVAELEEIKKKYEKTISGRIKGMFKKD